MELTEQNYYSLDANKAFCSVSQFKSFYGLNGCEAKAMAEIRGEYVRPATDALLLGSYVDTLLTDPNNVDKFLAENPQMISSRGATAGQLKSEYKKAETMVERVKQDEVMMDYLTNCEHQKIFVGNVFGMDFKIKIDAYCEDRAIVDLKTVESLHKSYWNPITRVSESFVQHFDYILQGAIYQEVVYQNTGKRLPFLLACVSKEVIPDIELIWIPNDVLKERLYGNELGGGIAEQVNQIKLLKSGETEPRECGHCDYCLPRKKIKKPIHYLDLLGEMDK